MATGTPAPARLRPDDAEDYVALRREMLADSPWAFMASEGDDRGLDPDGMRESLGRAEGFAVVGVRDDVGRLVGAAGVAREGKAKRRHVAVVWGVYVTPGWRGRGVGRTLVAAAMDAARGWAGVEVAMLSVSERSPGARRVYESLGFVAWGTEPDALRVDRRSYAETHLSARLHGAGPGPNGG